MFYISVSETYQKEKQEVKNLKVLNFKELPGIKFAVYQELNSSLWIIVEQEFGFKVTEKSTLKELKTFIVNNAEKILNSLEQIRKNPPKNSKKIPLINIEQEEKIPSKLMKPLFINGMYNKDGKRIRANYIKIIGEYPIWINAGKPDKDYGRNEKDKYYLYIQHGDWLVITGLTEYELEQRAGEYKLNKEWYGSFEEREKYLNEHFYNGRKYIEAQALIREYLKKEEKAIEEYGKDETVQFELLKERINKCIANYIEARDNNGKFADFIGSLFLDELDKCEKIALVLRKEREKEEIKRKQIIAEQKVKEAEEKIQTEQKQIEEAENSFINGGIIKGGDIIVKLADKYNITIPIRTKGWILNNLTESIITVGNSVSYSYRYWKSKGATGSQKVYEVLSLIRSAIAKQQNTKIIA